MYEGFHNYRSPFDVEVNHHDWERWAGHTVWIQFRNEYATTGSEKALNNMLSVVTMDTPPSAKTSEVYTRKADLNVDLGLVAFVIIFVGLICYAFFG